MARPRKDRFEHDLEITNITKTEYEKHFVDRNCVMIKDVIYEIMSKSTPEKVYLKKVFK